MSLWLLLVILVGVLLCLEVIAFIVIANERWRTLNREAFRSWAAWAVANVRVNVGRTLKAIRKK